MFANFAKLDSPQRLVQFWQNLQTSRVLLIPNCTRQRMITYTNIMVETTYERSLSNYLLFELHSINRVSITKFSTLEFISTI